MTMAVAVQRESQQPTQPIWDVVEVAEHKAQLNLKHVAAQRPTRKIYPGSRSFGEVNRRELGTRVRNYIADESDHILFEGSYLQPVDDGKQIMSSKPAQKQRLLLSGGGLRSAPRESSSLKILGSSGKEGLAARDGEADWEELTGKSHPLKDGNLPALPLCPDEANAWKDGTGPLGICVIGGTGAGKTCLVYSMLALLREGQRYPSRFDPEADAYPEGTPTFGAHYRFPKTFRPTPGARPMEREILLTDTRGCGLGPHENPLVAGVSPNSTRHFNAIPQWMRIALTHTPMKAVVIVLDSMALPLWEEEKKAKALARLSSVLLKNRFSVLFAVTKLHQTFKLAKAKQNGSAFVEPDLQLPNLGSGSEKVTCYESYAQKYLSRVQAAIQAAAEKNGFPVACEEEADFPRVGRSLFDIVTFKNVGDFKQCLGSRCTKTLPNFQYASNQMEKLFAAAVREPAREAPQAVLQLDGGCPL